MYFHEAYSICIKESHVVCKPQFGHPDIESLWSNCRVIDCTHFLLHHVLFGTQVVCSDVSRRSQEAAWADKGIKEVLATNISTNVHLELLIVIPGTNAGPQSLPATPPQWCSKIFCSKIGADCRIYNDSLQFSVVLTFLTKGTGEVEVGQLFVSLTICGRSYHA